MLMSDERITRLAVLYLRLGLGAAFLSAVADRFGLWGAFGHPQVAWGDFSHFTAYTAKLNWFLPRTVIPAVAWLATIAELVLGMALLVGVSVRPAAFASSALLTLFALAMTFARGPKAPLDYSVFTAAGGGMLLGAACKPPKARAHLSDAEI
jgi:uncharacterized membrane protein YphA (DoxX/SURF4 family)